MLLIGLIFIPACSSKNDVGDAFPKPKIAFAPEQYVCYRTDAPIKIDGKLDEAIWETAKWTKTFVDIEGTSKPEPRFRTRAKMLWDTTYFYVAAELEEPHVWAALTRRDAVIFYDNDFEIFIDPDGDTHQYYEFEMNAFSTEWDLLLIKPYRDGGPAVNAWDIQGLKSAVHVDGTINQPGDKDTGWSLEVAIPWSVLKECAHKKAPPIAGDQWRVNFSRVEWQVEVKDGKYSKIINPETGKPYPEDNWVWSPQGIINMHYPEMWGFVQFSDKIAGTGKDEFRFNPEENAKWVLRQVYYLERTHFMRHNKYTDELSEIDEGDLSAEGYCMPPVIDCTKNFFEASIKHLNSADEWHISQDGRVWK
ncbi:carbohydrate-binding family 9-like protein [candidate division KSB1 bacterium]|nr:carbohydrate-binding family 9-like protein [candidate division KSB1 bacterium]